MLVLYVKACVFNGNTLIKLRVLSKTTQKLINEGFVFKVLYRLLENTSLRILTLSSFCETAAFYSAAFCPCPLCRGTRATGGACG